MGAESKNGSIFSLYSREKIISHKDPQGREVKILLIKMTQRERSASFEVFNKVKFEEEEKLKKDEEKNQTQSKIISIFPKEQLISGILEFERIQRARFSDLYPFEEEEKLSAEEERKKRKDLFKHWEKDRQKALESESIQSLRKILLEDRIESLSIIEAGRMFDHARLSFICRHPQTKENIFKDYVQLEEIRDLRVMNWLLEELADFEKEEFAGEGAREEAKSSDFSLSGESRKLSEKSPPLKT